ncbi:hypothetical protein WA026_019927 [Henosepilachna vigintioctopunctata]|uniref:EF-hand domain-containing protein n=1 Tax=Henosepilachna vigintioctopunctata TaxID=420089 RepID=A0AAW1UX16_9CUCU
MKCQKGLTPNIDGVVEKKTKKNLIVEIVPPPPVRPLNRSNCKGGMIYEYNKFLDKATGSYPFEMEKLFQLPCQSTKRDSLDEDIYEDYRINQELERLAFVSSSYCPLKSRKGWGPTVDQGNIYFNNSPLLTVAPDTNDTKSTTLPASTTSQNAVTYKLFSTISYEATTSPNEDANYIENEIEDEPNDKGELYYDKEDCSMQEYEIMKDNLLLYNHARLMSQDNHSKDYLVSIMFSHYDRNNNGNLEATELNEIALQERLDSLSGGCSLSNMIQYDDTDNDGKLSINEFYVAFSKLYSKCLLCFSHCPCFVERYYIH